MFRPRTTILFLGDICFFTFALWFTLFVRDFEPPTWNTFVQHSTPFSMLFVVWVAVYFIAGLYESRSIILARRTISDTLLIAQTLNVAIAALFFFFVPIYGIAPKTVLLIYLCVSFLFVLFWRAILFPLLGLKKTDAAIMIGHGPEVDELVQALMKARFAPARVEVVVDPNSPSLSKQIATAVAQVNPRFIIADFTDPRVSSSLPGLYNYLAQGIRFFDAATLYEDVFGRVPLREVSQEWLARNVSIYTRGWYDSVKRIVDSFLAVVGGIISLLVYPFIILAIKIEDGGPAFVALERVGQSGKTIHMYKFRSMTGNDGGNYGPGGVTKLSVTKVGKFLRRTRLDELPQFWNMFIGDISFVGPRPETPALVAVYEKEIPYYGVRHLIKPGLSGSAQLYYHGDPHGAVDVESTKMKLSYDLFYLKHRSLTLDLSIIIKTIRRLLMRTNA